MLNHKNQSFKASSLTMFAFVMLALSVILTSKARADFYVVQDTEFGYTFSVPDRWYEVGGMASRLSHVFMAPQLDGEVDGAGCSVWSEKDKRFLVATAHELDHYVGREFTNEFFEIQTPRMNIGKNDAININVHGINPGGLGDGFARYALVDYTALSGLDKRAVIYATVYGDMMMIVSCQSKQMTFERRLPEFTNVISSFDFENFYRAYPTFYYRDFLGTDRTLLEVWLQDLISTIKTSIQDIAN